MTSNIQPDKCGGSLGIYSPHAARVLGFPPWRPDLLTSLDLNGLGKGYRSPLRAGIHYKEHIYEVIEKLYKKRIKKDV